MTSVWPAATMPSATERWSMFDDVADGQEVAAVGS